MLDALVAVSFGGFGVALWRRLPIPGMLMLGTALTWLLGDLGGALVFVHRCPLLHLLLAYPRAVPRRREAQAVMVAGYVDGLVYPIGHNDVVTVVLIAGLLVAVLLEYVSSAGLEHRARRVPSLAAATVAVVLTAGALARLADQPMDRGVLDAYQLVLIGIPFVLYADARWGRWSRATLTRLVVDLGDAIATTPLRDKLAAALSDPSLVVGYPAPSGDGLVDEAGRPLLALPDDTSRATTTIRDGDRVLAVLEHDPVVLGDRALLDSVTALARIAVANIGLRADVLAAITELEQSRRRLLDVADTERARLAAELEVGALARLDRVSVAVTEAALRRDVDDCRRALAEFARGVHPRTLTERGLTAAVRELAAEVPVAITLDVDVPRVDPAVETAAYFVCAEALTNIAKHVPYATAQVRMYVELGAVCVDVADDGFGGADPAAGSGLRGLADRVDVLGGTLTVRSPPGDGTTVRAVLPLTSEAPPPAAGNAY